MTTTTAPANPRSRVILASLVGTTIEFYDFYVYATAAVLVFPVLFFPTGNDTTSLLASFGVFGAAMIARPIGAVVFGHFGDKFGRKATLVASLLTMGIATFLIGLLPTFQQINWWAALLLLVLRLAQGMPRRAGPATAVVAANLADADATTAAMLLRLAARAVGRVTGRVDVEEVLGAIFGRFCIGK